MLHNQTIAFSWETEEFEFKEKQKQWYWIVGIVAVILITVALFLRNYLFAFVLAIGTFLMMSLATKKPLSLPIEISEHGIKIYNDTYEYASLLGFWIMEDNKGNAKLLILSNKNISPLTGINIAPEIDPMDIREYLLNFIEEQEMQESLTDRIIDKIGF